jgi:hypothetical protein
MYECPVSGSNKNSAKKPAPIRCEQAIQQTALTQKSIKQYVSRAKERSLLLRKL